MLGATAHVVPVQLVRAVLWIPLEKQLDVGRIARLICRALRCRNRTGAGVDRRARKHAIAVISRSDAALA